MVDSVGFKFQKSTISFTDKPLSSSEKEVKTKSALAFNTVYRNCSVHDVYSRVKIWDLDITDAKTEKAKVTFLETQILELIVDIHSKTI